ncbi:MAG: glycosyltransferase family 2 protein [Mycobacteriales bacterium]
MPAISVVVISRDRRKSLLATLGRLSALPERSPILVVDNGSGDGTPEAVRADFPAVRLIEARRNLGSAGRTLGVRAARTPYVAFADDDSWWAPGALAAAADLFAASPRLALLAARVLVGPAERLDPVCAAMAASPLGQAADLPGPSVLGFLACGAVIRRSAYLEVGGFHDRFGVGGEEELLAIDLAARGWGLAYVDFVVAHHHPSPGRDPAARARTQVRNTLWSAWLRRPLPTVVRQAVGLSPRLPREPAARAGLLAALRGLPWVLRERRVVAAGLERSLRRLGA